MLYSIRAKQCFYLPLSKLEMHLCINAAAAKDMNLFIIP